MPKRTQIVCICEGKQDSADRVFVNAFLNAYHPQWVRPQRQSSYVRVVPYRGKANLLKHFPTEVNACAAQGSDTTLIVLADVDDDKHGCRDCEDLKSIYWQKAQESEITEEQFEKVVFIFPKDRIENWVEFLNTGATNENEEGPRVHSAKVKVAAKKLAQQCQNSAGTTPPLPPSLQWSCRNWRALVDRMK